MELDIQRRSLRDLVNLDCIWKLETLQIIAR